MLSPLESCLYYGFPVVVLWLAPNWAMRGQDPLTVQVCGWVWPLVGGLRGEVGLCCTADCQVGPWR